MHVYKITNLLNNKVYIGQTTAKNPIRRWIEHKSKAKHSPNTEILKAIAEYGYKNFKFEIIQKCNSEEELILIENQNIILYNSLYPNGYNLERSQLNNRILCKKSKIKMSKSQQGIKKDSISKYIGVYQDQNSWFCEIAHNRIKYKKSFKNELKCALAYDKMAIFFYGKDAKLNFPQRINKYNKFKIDKFYNYFIFKRSENECGIYWDKNRKKYRARLIFNKRRYYLGQVDTYKEAVKLTTDKYNELKEFINIS